MTLFEGLMVFVLIIEGTVGGVMVGSDYGYWKGQKDALDGKFKYQYVTNNIVEFKELQH